MALARQGAVPRGTMRPRAARLAAAPPTILTARSRATRWSGLGTPFVLLHVAVLAVVFVGWSRAALLVGAVSYGARAFGITAFYHRCFAHRSFRVPRVVQLAGAVLGAAAAQRGPLWWVSHHREHHRYTDRPGDPHSPVVDGFWYSHVLWVFHPDNAATNLKRVEDLARFPELRLLDRFEYVVPGGLPPWPRSCWGLFWATPAPAWGPPGPKWSCGASSSRPSPSTTPLSPLTRSPIASAGAGSTRPTPAATTG